MQGFIVFDYEKQYPQARRDLAQWLAEGKIQRRETIVKGGLEKAETALAGLYQGLNTGAYYTQLIVKDRTKLFTKANCWLKSNQKTAKYQHTCKFMYTISSFTSKLELVILGCQMLHNEKECFSAPNCCL